VLNDVHRRGPDETIEPFRRRAVAISAGLSRRLAA
jgi:hypothetical protein